MTLILLKAELKTFENIQFSVSTHHTPNLICKPNIFIQKNYSAREEVI